jgi:DNA-binding CsgD family transcriptional regulator
VAVLDGQDLRGALGMIEAACAAGGPGPFAGPVVDALARLVPGEIAGYNERELPSHRLLAAHETPAVRSPPDVARAVTAFCGEYPLSVERHWVDGRAHKVSDFVSPAELHRLDYYNHALRPMGIEHQIRLWLPAPPGQARFFYVSRRRGDADFDERDRLVLELVRPFLAAVRERTGLPVPAAANHTDLTGREAEILAWVARGKTNKEIARLVMASPHTVRKHLEHAFRKLGVHTRTAAVSRAFGFSD